MTDEIKGAVAEALQENNSGQNLTPQAFANRRIKQLQPEVPQEEPKEEVSEQVEETQTEEPVAEVQEQAQEEVQEEVTEETKETESTEDVLSQYNLDEMSEDDLKELSEKLGSRAVARFGELTAKRKAAEEKLAELQNQLKTKQDPLDVKKSIENNPYANLDSIEKIQDKAKEVNEIISWAEDKLFEADGYSADDVITEVEGKEVTKAQVRKSLLQARKARDAFLPDQLNKVQLKESSKELETAFEKQAKEELSWLSGEDNDTRKRYESMMQDQRFVKLKKEVDPDISAQLPYIIAHAANSIYGRKLIPQDKPKVSITPPKTGATAAPTQSRANKSTKALADLNSRFKDSGSRDDFIKLRTKQLTR